ncbi:MAG: AraC family transcriptional regulator [Hyphomicrobiales bacterium]|nr:AraC family transcriptional regulator [Hyphomicrobiales bacterium]
MQTGTRQKITDLLSDAGMAALLSPQDGSEQAPQIWTGALVGLPEMLQEHGLDYEGVLAEFGLTREQVEDPKSFIPMEKYAGILALAAERTGDPLFALHLGERSGPSRNHLLFYVYSNAPTLKSAIEAAVRYARLVARISSSFSIHDDVGSFEFSCEPPREIFMHKDCASMARWLKQFQSVLGDDWKPLSAGFAHSRPDDISEYVRLFGENIAFDQRANTIRFDIHALATPMPEADAGLFDVLRSYCEQLLKELDRGDDPLQKIRTYIADNLSGGLLSPADVATGTGLAIDELQTILKSRNISFRDLQDELRKGLAARYLTETDLRCGEIAFLLGFSEQSAFTRAGKRWFGMSPLDYRRNPSQKRAV